MDAYEKEIPLKDVLMRNESVTGAFTEAEIDDMLNPLAYVGLAPEFADRVVAKWTAK